MAQENAPLTELTDVLAALLEDIRQTTLAGEELSETQLSSLRTMFGQTLYKALQLVENNQVKCYTSCNSDNRVYTVTTDTRDSTKTVYVVLPYHYCKCESFGFHTMIAKTQIFCKHILATWLANALNKCIEVEVDDEELKHILHKHY